jgi:hypothetical protein
MRYSSLGFPCATQATTVTVQLISGIIAVLLNEQLYCYQIISSMLVGCRLLKVQHHTCLYDDLYTSYLNASKSFACSWKKICTLLVLLWLLLFQLQIVAVRCDSSRGAGAVFVHLREEAENQTSMLQQGFNSNSMIMSVFTLRGFWFLHCLKG